MIEIYADLVEAGKRSLDGKNNISKVPDKYLNAVIDELEKRNVKIYGLPRLYFQIESCI